MKIKVFFFLISSLSLSAQNINVNDDYTYSFLRNSILKGEINTNYSFNIKPVESNYFNESLKNNYKNVFSNKKNNVKIKFLGIDYFLDYNTTHPYNRNNGSMIPNRGYQHIISPGIFVKIGALSIQFKPEHHFSENKVFNGFWEGHYDKIWAERFRLWNIIDMPERHGDMRFNRTKFGQSSVRLNFKNLSIGISNENLWWGPSIRNSIMLSNHAEGFPHITFNTIKPLKTIIGNFEWQLISARLENSGFDPPSKERKYAGTRIFIPRTNQLGQTDDWRYLQAFILNYSPEFIDGLNIGLIRWSQFYGAMLNGKYWWMNGRPTYFPVFQNIFRQNDRNVDYEAQTNQAGGIFFKWFWKESKSEIYAEFHSNDSRFNFRDLILDTDHSRAMTLGLRKNFKINRNNFIFSWEWTQMEQTAGRLIRNAGSWYEHPWVKDGYTHKGEVLGSGIGPGSNSHYISINKIINSENLGFALEIIDNDNDFYYEAFASAKDFRRYWKDFNFHLVYKKGYKNFNLSSNFIFIRSLNYQWQLDDFSEPYYHPGRDVNNFHLSLKFTYFGNW